MVDYKYSELYKQESVDKQLNIAFDSGNIANEEIHSEQFELTESLCSDAQLRFGSCEASMIKFRISNIFTPLKDKWLTVTETLNHNTDTPFKFGKYKVYSDTPTADRRYRDVVAYDKMYDIINTDLTEWYNSIFPTDDTEIALKEFRTSLMNYLGVEQEDVTLVNDNMVVKKTIQPTQLAGVDVISTICEINGCFGHIGRDGKFHYVFLEKRIQGLYPANDLYPKDDLFPREHNTNKIDKLLYIDCKYEDYLSQKITKIQIRQEENDIGKTYPGGETTDLDNTYVVQGNFLVYGKEETELEDIAKKLFSVISGTEYRPYEAQVIGNPCFEVGDAIRFNTSYQIVESYILKRTLTGVQGLRDELSADGEEYLSENAGGIESQIQQLKGKSNVLERNINETVSKISDVEQGLQSEIRQTASSITSTVAASQSKYDETGLEISKYGYGNPVGVSRPESIGEYYLNQENGGLYIGASDGHQPIWVFVKYLPLISEELSSQIEQTAKGIIQTVSANYETKNDASNTKIELKSQIEQTAESITQTVSKSTSKYDTTGYDITLFGYGTPDDNNYLPDEHNGEYYLDQETGKVYLSNGSHKWIHVNTLKLITEELSSQIEQAVGSIVLKVDANGKIVEVALTGDPEEGTTFTVDADNISLTATEVIDMLSNGEINLTGKNITITSDNFNVDKDGNMSCENASVTGDVNATSLNVFKTLRLFVGTTFDKDYADAVYADWGTTATGERVIIVYSNIEHFNKGIHSDGGISTSGGVSAAGMIYTEGDVVIPLGDISIGTAGKGIYFLSANKMLRSSGTNGVDVSFYDDINKEFLMDIKSDSINFHKTVYTPSGTVSKSDKESKHDISVLDSEKCAEFIYSLKPSEFRYNDGNSKRLHHGFIAQEVKDSMGDDDWGVYVDTSVSSTNEYNNNFKALRYEELIADLVGTVQYQQKEIDTLKKYVSFLMQKIGGGADE